MGADDVLPQVLWTINFIEREGYKVENKEMMQDNVSELKLKKKGGKSSSKQTKHILVRYSFTKDEIARRFALDTAQWM